MREAESGSGGEFVLPALPVGAYEVTAALAGFRPLAQRVTVVLGEPALLPLVLEPGATDEITVTGDAVSGADARRTAQLSRERAGGARPAAERPQLHRPRVPAARRAGASRTATAAPSSRTGCGASVNGQDPRSNVYLLDGTLHERLHERPRRQRRRHGARHRDGARVPGGDERVLGAEFGRNAGGQINVVTKSGSNDFTAALYEYHRNDALDARNFFDPDEKPDFMRNQFGGTRRRARCASDQHASSSSATRACASGLGRTISTVVPGRGGAPGRPARPAQPGGTLTVPVSPAVRPYLDEFPLAERGERSAAASRPSRSRSTQTLDQDYFQVRLDQNLGARRPALRALHVRPRRASCCRPTSRSSRGPSSRTNHFVTAEYRRVFSARTLAHGARSAGAARASARRCRRTPRSRFPPFVPGRALVGDIDIGGIPRFGPQSSGDLELAPGRVLARGRRRHSRGRHLLKAGALVERYQSRPGRTRRSASASTPSPTSSRSCATGRCVSSGSRPEAQTSERNWPLHAPRRSTCRTTSA